VEGYLQIGVNTTLDISTAAAIGLDEIATRTSDQIFKQTLCSACPLFVNGRCEPLQFPLDKNNVVIIPKAVSKTVRFTKPPHNPQHLRQKSYAALPLGV